MVALIGIRETIWLCWSNI